MHFCSAPCVNRRFLCAKGDIIGRYGWIVGVTCQCGGTGSLGSGGWRNRGPIDTPGWLFEDLPDFSRAVLRQPFAGVFNLNRHRGDALSPQEAAIFRGSMSGAAWAFLAPFPSRNRRQNARRPLGHRRIPDGILHAQRRDVPWRDQRPCAGGKTYPPFPAHSPIRLPSGSSGRRSAHPHPHVPRSA